MISVGWQVQLFDMVWLCTWTLAFVLTTSFLNEGLTFNILLSLFSFELHTDFRFIEIKYYNNGNNWIQYRYLFYCAFSNMFRSVSPWWTCLLAFILEWAGHSPWPYTIPPGHVDAARPVIASNCLPTSLIPLVTEKKAVENPVSSHIIAASKNALNVLNASSVFRVSTCVLGIVGSFLISLDGVEKVMQDLDCWTKFCRNMRRWSHALSYIRLYYLLFLYLKWEHKKWVTCCFWKSPWVDDFQAPKLQNLMNLTTQNTFTFFRLNYSSRKVDTSKPPEWYNASIMPRLKWILWRCNATCSWFPDTEVQ